MAADDTFFQNPTTSFDSIIEKALFLMSEKILRLGRGFMEYCLLSAAWGLVMSRLSEVDTEKLRHESVQKIGRLYYKILAGQEYSNVAKLGGTGACNLLADSDMPALPPALGGKEVTTPRMVLPDPDLSFAEYEYEDLSNWSFDAFWPFDPNNL
jgi:hypothetical protein